MKKKEKLKNNEKFKNKTTSKNDSNLISKHQPLISDHNGITLIALVITIIIMLFLVGVTVTIALNGGLFNTTKEAAKGTQFDADRESLLAAVLGSIDRKSKVDYGELEEHLPEGFKKVAEGEYQSESGNTFYVDKYGNISTEKGEDAPPEVEEEDVELAKGYIGNYADIDGDKKVDGIIYADLAVDGEGTWNDGDWSNFSYKKQTGSFKQYVITEKATAFGNVERDVIKAVPESDGQDRFYVMALKDVDETKHTWYSNAYGKLPSGKLTEETEGRIVEPSDNDFGKGKENTKYWLEKYGTIDGAEASENDLWNILKKEDTEKWFVPSKAELAAFGWLLFQPKTNNGFDVTTSNYSTFDLKPNYWSSSQYDTYYVYLGSFINFYVRNRSVNSNDYYVRLSTTF